MKKYSILFFFLMFVNLGFSQNKKIDSLRQELMDSSVSDTSTVNNYYFLAKQYASINIDSFSLYNKKALKISLKANEHRLAKIYGFIGTQNGMQSQLDSARHYFHKALKVLDRKDDIETRALMYQNIAVTYNDSGDFEKKLFYNLKAIDLFKDDPFNLSNAHFNQGAIYMQAEMNNEATEYFRSAYNLSIKGKNLRMETSSLMALGAMFIKVKKPDSARVYLEKGLEICETTKSPYGCFQIYNKLGNVYDDLKLFDKGKLALLEAEKYAKMLGADKQIMMSVGSLGTHEFKLKNYKKAATYYKKFEKLYEKNPKVNLGVTVYRNWSKAEGRLGNFEKAQALLEKYLTIKDSIFSKENRAIITNSEAKYQTEKKDKEIAEQQLQLEQHKTQLQKNKIQYSYMTGAALLLLVTSVLLWFLYQQRQKRKNQEILTLKREHQVQTLESLMEGEEKERFRIAKELHDGVNGDLSAIKFKLSSLLEMNNTVIKEAVTMIDKSCQQVRAISHNLIPPSLQDFNLTEALEEYCTNMDAIHSPNITFQQLGDTIVLTKKQEANIFRIVQELVNNSIKHAESDKISVQISSRKGVIQITVEDNGIGYDKQDINTDGIGLKNIQSRVDYLNATLDLVSNTGGTSSTIELEINKLNKN